MFLLADGGVSFSVPSTHILWCLFRIAAVYPMWSSLLVIPMLDRDRKRASEYCPGNQNRSWQDTSTLVGTQPRPCVVRKPAIHSFPLRIEHCTLRRAILRRPQHKNLQREVVEDLEGEDGYAINPSNERAFDWAAVETIGRHRWMSALIPRLPPAKNFLIVGVLLLDMRALSTLMCGLRSPVPCGHVLGYVEGPNKHDAFHPSWQPSENFTMIEYGDSTN